MVSKVATEKHMERQREQSRTEEQGCDERSGGGGPEGGEGEGGMCLLLLGSTETSLLLT